MTELNPGRAFAALDAALAHRQHFNMGMWVKFGADVETMSLADLVTPDCGTTACLAGWVVAMEGYLMYPGGGVLDKDGVWIGTAEEVAGDLLGITLEQGGRLFYTDEDQVVTVVEQMFGPRPVPAR